MVKRWPWVTVFVTASSGFHHHVASFQLQTVDVIRREVEHDHQQIGEEEKAVRKAVNVPLTVELSGSWAAKGQKRDGKRCRKLKEIVEREGAVDGVSVESQQTEPRSKLRASIGLQLGCSATGAREGTVMAVVKAGSDVRESVSWGTTLSAFLLRHSKNARTTAVKKEEMAKIVTQMIASVGDVGSG
jgi:hypothetical protein